MTRDKNPSFSYPAALVQEIQELPLPSPSSQETGQRVTIKNEADALAACAHMLGYWPQNSLVVLLTDGKDLGPLLRVDGPNPDQDLPSYFSYLFSTLPVDPASDNYEAFIFYFGNYRPQHISQGRGQEPLSPADHALEESFWQQTNRLLLPLLDEMDRNPLKVIDFIALGPACYWSLSPQEPYLQPAHRLEAISHSPIYLKLQGSEQDLPYSFQEARGQAAEDLSQTQDPAAREAWLLEAELAAQEEAAKRKEVPSNFRQMLLDISCWGLVLDACQQAGALEENLTQAQGADRLRASLSPQLAGFLTASLLSPTCLTLLLYTAAFGAERAQEAILALSQELGQPLSQDPDPFPAPGLDRLLLPLEELDQQFEALASNHEQVGRDFTAHFLADVPEEPDWRRLLLLQRISSLLEGICVQEANWACITLQAWISWYGGKTSLSSHYLDSLPGEAGSYPVGLLEGIHHFGKLPAWMAQARSLPGPSSPLFWR